MTEEEMLDEDVALRLNAFDESLDKVGNHLKAICGQEPEIYAAMDLEDKSRHDLFLAYSVNALFWTYLRTLGMNPVSCGGEGENEKPHPVTEELKRVRTSLERAKIIAEKKKAARLDIRATNRFVRGALWTPGQSGGVADQLRDLDRTAAKLNTAKDEKKHIVKKDD